MDLFCDGLAVLPVHATSKLHYIQPCNHGHKGFKMKLTDEVVMQAAPYFAYVYYAIGKHLEANGSMYLSQLGKLLDNPLTADRGSPSAPAPVTPPPSNREAAKMIETGHFVKPVCVEKVHRETELVCTANAQVVADEFIRRRANEAPLATHLMNPAKDLEDDVDVDLDCDIAVNWEAEADAMLKACGHLEYVSSDVVLLMSH